MGCYSPLCPLTRGIRETVFCEFDDCWWSMGTIKFVAKVEQVTRRRENTDWVAPPLTQTRWRSPIRSDSNVESRPRPTSLNHFHHHHRRLQPNNRPAVLHRLRTTPKNKIAKIQILHAISALPKNWIHYQTRQTNQLFAGLNRTQEQHKPNESWFSLYSGHSVPQLCELGECYQGLAISEVLAEGTQCKEILWRVVRAV